MTDAMEALLSCLSFNKVPATWNDNAYFSKKPLILWFSDMLDRVA